MKKKSNCKLLFDSSNNDMLVVMIVGIGNGGRRSPLLPPNYKMACRRICDFPRIFKMNFFDFEMHNPVEMHEQHTQAWSHKYTNTYI